MNIQSSMRQAVQALNAGQFRQVETICRKILKSSPGQPNALHLMGIAALLTGRNERAVELVEKAAARKPGSAAFNSTLSEAYRALGSHDKAVALAERALKIDPERAETHCSLGNALQAQGKHDDAVASFDRALKIDPSLAKAHYNKGNTLADKGDLDAAVAAYRRAVATDPDLADAHYNLGNLLSARGDLTAAIDAYLQALEVMPGFVNAWHNMGNALRKLGRLNAAKQAYERVLEVDSTRAAAHLHLGTIAKLQDRFDAARTSLTRAIELDPDNALAHSELAHVDHIQRNNVTAIAGYRRAVEISPSFAWGYMGLSSALAETGQADAARDAAHKAVHLRRTLEAAFLGREPIGRVVVLQGVEDAHFIAGADDGMSIVNGMNNVHEHFDRERFVRSSFYVDGLEPGTELDALPNCDVIYNAISDVDAMPECQKIAERIAAAVQVPVINRPDVIAKSTRDLNSRYLGNIDGIVFPKTLRVMGPVSSTVEVARRLDEAGLQLPALVRRAGTHVSESLEKIEDIDRLTAILSAGPAGAFYITEYVDYATKAGEYKKMRFHVIDGQMYATQLWFSRDWLIPHGRGLRPRMLENPWMMDEVRHFMEAPKDYLGDDAYNALASVHARLPLDYFGIDFSRLPDGRIIVFEANAAMRITPVTADEFDFRKPVLEAISRAARTLLANRVEQSKLQTTRP